MVISLVIPRKPLTTNHIYGQKKYGKGRFLKDEAKDFKKEIQILMRGKRLPYDESKHYVGIEYYIYLSNFWTKKKKINLKSGDCDNFKKLVQDSIFDCLKINDAIICDDGTKKRYGEKDTTVIIIRLHPLEELGEPLTHLVSGI